MPRSHSSSLVVVGLLGLAALAPPAVAQIGDGMLAPSSAMDTLNSGPVGPSPQVIDRVNATPGIQQGQGGGNGAVPIGSPGGAVAPPPGAGTAVFASPGDFQAGPAPFDPSAPAGAPAAAQNVPKAQAFYGTRLRCKITGQLLQDARRVTVIATLLSSGNYSDDGKTLGDAKAGDGIYTHVDFKNDVISPEANLVKSRVITSLINASKIPPADFFNIRVATSEPLSATTNVLEAEAQRDAKLEEWGKAFLRDYRVTPEDPASPFIPVYIPIPPRAPRLPVPATFYPSGGNGPVLASGLGSPNAPAGPQVRQQAQQQMGAGNQDVMVSGQTTTGNGYMNTSAFTGK